MSLSNTSYAICPHCGKRMEITTYRSINASSDPALAARVKDGSLFVWTCPSCGNSNLAKYECLYHDPDRKLMVWLVPGGEFPEDQMQSILYHAEAMGGYTLRRVKDVTSLVEKLTVFENGLSDVAVEMCKYVTKAEMAARAEEERRAELMNIPMHLHSVGEQDGMRYLVLAFPDDGKFLSCRIGFNVYEDCSGILERNPSIHPEEGFARVDADWLSNVIR